MKEKLAKIISSVFDPRITVPLLFLSIIFKGNLISKQIEINLFLVLLIDIIFPNVVWYLFFKEGLVSSWEIDKLKERFGFMFTVSVLGLGGISLFYFFGSRLIFKFHLILLTAFFLATIVSKKFKISIHTLVDTTVFFLLIFLSLRFWPIIFLLPFIAWSRYVRHKHTPTQLLGGFLLGLTVVFLGVNLFHL